ncbi:MAG: 30S ribosomal protein S12 methylthiotransferase RimO [Anaerolineae bacterium]|nr:30S ribosomal protein S12 methylthiotransferase RimO [Anaerolineae bacterium]MDW8173943.1 30S ribosomal protein S12 methylthiotransferase RimO [Anaerolineae bacterium]
MTKHPMARRTVAPSAVTRRKNKYFLLSLGCSKNTVDSESMAQVLSQQGMIGVDVPQEAEVLIVNTCGFIDSAKQESIHALRELVEQKRQGQMVIAAGCLSQRYGRALVSEVPGLDGIIGTRRWMDIFDLVTRLRDRLHPEPLYHLPTDVKTVGLDERGVLRASVQGASAYLKIADGCRRPCAFCAIPKIKGTAVSRPVESIVAEAVRLEAMGVREVLLIAQDTTDYGYDLGLKDGLAYLLEAIVRAAPNIPWIRIMYAYPGYVTERLMEVMARYPQILPYLDMPLQHAHRETLKRMKRPAKVEWVYETVAKLRVMLPSLAIRTTFIVGYPGETEEEFETLIQFIRDLQFDRVGAFKYSYEIGTPSATLPNQVDDETKQVRYNRLMAVQQGISLAKNQALVGQTLSVLVEGHGQAEDEDGQTLEAAISLGRSYRDAPEVDGYVLVEGELPIGEIVPVRITGATVYDLIATVETGGPIVIQPGQIFAAGDLPGAN